jgi:hypothetical protein
MAVIEEFMVVAIYVVLGFMITKLDADAQGSIAGREWKQKRNRVERQRGGNSLGALQQQQV